MAMRHFRVAGRLVALQGETTVVTAVPDKCDNIGGILPKSMRNRSLSRFQSDERPTVIPRLFTSDVTGLVNFLRVSFDAHGEVQHGVAAEIRIGDSIILVSDGGGVREPFTGFLYVYVEDTDAVYRTAIRAGAISIEVPADMPYGDRRATVRGAWGNIWQIATYRAP